MELFGYQIEYGIEKSDSVETYLARSKAQDEVCLQVFDLTKLNTAFDDNAEDLLDRYVSAGIPNIERVLDSGRTEKHFYVVFETRKVTDTLSNHMVAGIETKRLIEYTKTLLSTLQSIYRAGLSHGAVCPGRISIRPDGTAQLLNVLSSTLLTKTGNHQSVDIEYLSPERVLGDEGTLLGDFYAIGVIVYECLVGSLPWKQVSYETLRSSSQSIPPLPKRFEYWEPFLKKLLEFDTAARYVDLEELLEDLYEIQESTENVVLTSQIVDDSEINAVVHGLEVEQEERQESIRRQEKRGFFVRLATVVTPVVLLVLLIYAPQNHAVRVWFSEVGIGEHPDLQAARQNAAALRADPNQSFQAIVGAYDNVLQYSPNDAEATAAKLLVKEDWQNTIQRGLEANDLGLAQNRVEELLAVYPDDDTATSFFNRIQKRRQALGLLSDAEALFGEKGYDSLSAITIINLYKETARLYPDNDVTASRLDDFAVYFANLTINAAKAGEVAQAIEHLNKADTANADHPLLRSARDALLAAETLQQEINQRLTLARQLRTSGNLIMPANNNAATIYKQVLTTDQRNVVARDGLAQINSDVRKEFDILVVRRDFTAADEMLTAAKEVGLAADTINYLNSQYLEGQRQQAVAKSMVDEARERFLLGYITEPPGDNAIEMVRQALREDPNNVDAHNLLQQCSARLARVAQDAHQAGFRYDAAVYLELAISAYPNDLALLELKEDWLRTDMSSIE